MSLRKSSIGHSAILDDKEALRGVTTTTAKFSKMVHRGVTETLALRTAVRVVIREQLLSRGIGLPHAARAIDDFLNDLPQDWSIEEAYERTGSLRCLQYMAVREREDAVEPFYRVWVVNNVAGLAVRCEDVETLTWIAENYAPDAPLTRSAAAAAASGRLDVLKWLHKDHFDRVKWGGIEWHEALGGGHMAVVHWLRCHVTPHKEAAPQLMIDAARAGNLELVQWFLKEYELPVSSALEEAEKYHQWGVVKWILVNCEVEDSSVDMDAISEDGNVEFMVWVYQNGFGRSPFQAVGLAAVNGHIDVLQWLHEGPLHIELNPSVFNEAARGGHLDVVKWLHARKCPATPTTLDCAAENGHFEVAKWLYANRKEGCTSRALDGAARNGHLDVVKWLHSTGTHFYCPAAMNRAAEHGHLEVVKWLHLHRPEGCTIEAMDCACHQGHLDVAQWLDANRSEGCGIWAMDLAASSGRLDAVKWLDGHLHKTCTAWAMNSAARQGYLNVVKWLHANRTEGCTSDAMSTAASNGHLDVVRWLHRNRTESCVSTALNNAIAGDHLDVAMFLRRERKLTCSHESGVTLRGLRSEMVKWLIKECRDELERGMKFQIARYDWSYNDWMKRQNMRKVQQDSSNVVWEWSPQG